MPSKRKKRSDTRIGTVEKKYGVDLNVRSDMKLSSYLKRVGLPSLSKLINRNNRKK